MSANRTELLNCSNPRAENIGLTVTYSLLFLVSITGNISIGIIVYKTSTMRKPINFFIVNMAMSDILSASSLILLIVTELNVDSWLESGPLGHGLCKLVFSLPSFSISVSIQSLVLIAVDRFGAVVFPLRSPLISSKLCPFFILSIWIVATVITLPSLLAVNLVEYRAGPVCFLRWNEAFEGSFSFKYYTLAFIVVLCYFPFLFIAVLYLTIVLKLKSQKIPGEQSTNLRQQRVERERNVLKMSIAIVLAFAVCWLPISIYWIAFFYLSEGAVTLSCGLKYFIIAISFLAQLNCVINPCICFTFSGNYRQGLKNLFSCFCAA